MHKIHLRQNKKKKQPLKINLLYEHGMAAPLNEQIILYLNIRDTSFPQLWPLRNYQTRHPLHHLYKKTTKWQLAKHTDVYHSLKGFIKKMKVRVNSNQDLRLRYKSQVYFSENM